MAAAYPDAMGSRAPKLYFYCLSIELGLKAAIFAKAPDRDTKAQLKKMGHDLVALLNRFEQDWCVAALEAEQRAHVERISGYFHRKGLEYFTGEMMMAIMQGWRDLPEPAELEAAAASINRFLASHNHFIDA